jgi:HAD superfamily hydrolase (TIGR01509 family)
MLDFLLLELEEVLADTGALRAEALERALADSGVRLPAATLRDAQAGRPLREAIELVARHAGAPLDEVELDLATLRAQRGYEERLAQGVVLQPGAAALVAHTAGRARLALVTRASRQAADTVLRLAGLDTAFAAVVTADDVVNPKPHPEGYQAALERLARRGAVVRERMLALEDGQAGIRAARGAGLRVVVAGPLAAHLALEADGQLGSLDGVTLAALDELLGRTDAHLG